MKELFNEFIKAHREEPIDEYVRSVHIDVYNDNIATFTDTFISTKRTYTTSYRDFLRFMGNENNLPEAIFITVGLQKLSYEETLDYIKLIKNYED